MRVLYFDCFSGISGDMALGALIDAGLPLDDLQRALAGLLIDGAHVHAKRVLRAGVSATKFVVHEHAHVGKSTQHVHDHPEHVGESTQHVGESTQHVGESTQHVGESTQHVHDHPEHVGESGHHHRTVQEIFSLIDRTSLPTSTRDRAKAMFQRLAETEAAIHQMPIETVHLHEVGALDSIVDIVGIAFAMEWVGADRIVSSALNVGGGMVHSAHGHFPVPAPATMKLLGSAPVYSGAIQKELVTPTGALIVSTYASDFGPIPPMSVDRIGYGAGDRDDPGTPNVLRVLIGEAAGQGRGDRVVVVECEIDDMNPQIFGVVMERLYAVGALEVFYVPVQMKKNRPGTLLTVIVPPDRRAAVADVIFRETTTIGLRYSEVDRECLQREIVAIETPIGSVRFKVASRNGRTVNAVPEFDDCARLAASNNLSVKEVQAMAIAAFGQRQP